MCRQLSRVSQKSVLSLINDSNTKKKTKNPIKLTIADVRRHMSLLVSVRVAGVKFDSQSKNQLVGPKAGEFKLKIPDELLTGIKRWEIVDRLHQEIIVQQERLAKRSDGKKRTHVGLEKGTDANTAGSKDSDKCILCVGEGGSADLYILSLRAALGDYGYNFIGSLPLKGKCLNVRGKRVEDIYENAIERIEESLGSPREKVDYTDDNVFRSLRYGRLLIV